MGVYKFRKVGSQTSQINCRDSRFPQSHQSVGVFSSSIPRDNFQPRESFHTRAKNLFSLLAKSYESSGKSFTLLTYLQQTGTQFSWSHESAGGSCSSGMPRDNFQSRESFRTRAKDQISLPAKSYESSDQIKFYFVYLSAKDKEVI